MSCPPLRPADRLRRARALLPAWAAVAAVSGGCGVPEEEPDGTWRVTVTSVVEDGRIATDCGEEGATFSTYDQTFEYQLFVSEGDDGAELKIDGEGFATAQRQGCDLSYQSAVWLDERSTGLLRWQISGAATYQGAAGGCELPDGVDWKGTETITVVESEDPAIPSGCTYQLETEGVLTSGG